ncbi:MAG: hypothetical protein ACI3XG_02960 [Faecousia sp.]
MYHYWLSSVANTGETWEEFYARQNPNPSGDRSREYTYARKKANEILQGMMDDEETRASDEYEAALRGVDEASRKLYDASDDEFDIAISEYNSAVERFQEAEKRLSQAERAAKDTEAATRKSLIRYRESDAEMLAGQSTIAKQSKKESRRDTEEQRDTEKQNSATIPEIGNKLEFYLANKEDGSDYGNLPGGVPSLMQYGKNNMWDRATEGQRKTYAYLLGTEPEKAEEYLQAIQVEWSREALGEYISGLQSSWGKESGGMKALENAASVPANVLGSLLAGVDTISGMIAGDFNPYSQAHWGQQYAGTVRGLTTDDVYAAMGYDKNSGEEPNFLQKAVANAYNALMSAGDSAFGVMLLGKGYTATMGVGATAQKAQELYERGASDEEITMGALASGALETLFEYASLDLIIKNQGGDGLKNFFVSALKSAGVEASEEVFTEIANDIAEAVMFGANSDTADRENQYIADGLSPEEAKKQAILDAAVDVFWAGYGGLISGGAFSATGVPRVVAQQSAKVRDKIQQNSQYRKDGQSIIQNQAGPGLIQAAESSGVESKLVELAKQRADDKLEQMSWWQRRQAEKEMGKLYEQTLQAQEAQASQALRDSFQRAAEDRIAERLLQREAEQESQNQGIAPQGEESSAESAEDDFDREIDDFLTEQRASMENIDENDAEYQKGKRYLDAYNKIYEMAKNGASLDEINIAEGLYDISKAYPLSDEAVLKAFDAGRAAYNAGDEVSGGYENQLTTGQEAMTGGTEQNATEAGQDTKAEAGSAADKSIRESIQQVDPQKAAEALTKAAYGEELTEAEKKTVAAVGGEALINEIASSREFQENARARTADYARSMEDTMAMTQDTGKQKEIVSRFASENGMDADVMLGSIRRSQDANKFTAAWESAYEMGAGGIALRYAQKAGANSYLTQAQIETAYNEGRKAAGYYEEAAGEGTVSDGSQWNDRAYSGGQVRAVESGAAAQGQSGQQGAGGGIAAAAEKITSIQLGLENGTENRNLQRVTEAAYSEDTKAAAKVAKDNGLVFVPVSGGAIETLETGNGHKMKVKSRGCVVNGTMYVRVDDNTFTAEQIARHEAAHEQIRKGEIDVEDIRQSLLERYSPEEIDAIIQLYASAYGDSGLTAEEVLEEIVCDAMGKMNAFATDATERVAGEVGVFLRNVRKAAKNTGATKNTTGDGGGKYYSREMEYDPETAGIKDQIKNGADILNEMDPVDNLVVPENMKDKGSAAKWAIDILKKTGYAVERNGYGYIYFNENDIKYAMKYCDTPEEKAAIAALPKVLKRGVEIGGHQNHKNRNKSTITFAAPVVLNGIRGNMGVVVNQRGNHYYTHRIILPDGSAFVFGNKNDATQELYRGVTSKGSLADTTSVASTDKVAQPEGKVKQKYSRDTTNA